MFMKTTFTVQGTHCQGCKMLIEDVCKDMPGVSDCSVDFSTGKTAIEHDQSMNLDALKQAIEALGKYQVIL